ncbi:MAG TPA: ABC transporter substrate-binding protein [Chloroflexota bacterium]|nr:ABC transporter substrate-binding protein [Chloroflexota bacterium]
MSIWSRIVRERRAPNHLAAIGGAVALILAACGGSVAPAAGSASSGQAAPAASKAQSSGAQASTAPKQMLKLNLGLASKPAPALPNSVLWLAKDLGFYQREGLDVTLQELDGTPNVIAAMISGDLDVGNIGTDQLVKLAAQKSVDMRAINSSDARQYFLIASKDSLSSIAGLKGKTFGVAKAGSLDDTMTRLVLAAKGVKPGDLTFAGIGAPGVRAQALVAGRIDATTISLGTWVSIQHDPGVKILVTADDFYGAAPINLKVNAASTKTIKDKPEQLRRFTAAVLKASRTFSEDQNAWVNAMLKRRPDLKRADLEMLWPDFKQAWAANGLLNLSQYQKTSDFLYQTADFKGVPPVALSQWTDTQFADSVLREIGVDAKLDPPGRSI